MKPQKFTNDERNIIANAARRVWDDIGYDILDSVAREKRKSINAVSVSRADVIELVLDASRLEEQLRRTKGVDRSLIARVAEDIYHPPSEIESYLKTAVFTYTSYGM